MFELTGQEPPSDDVQPFHSSGPLLVHEDPDTTHPDDARRLIRIYGELIGFKHELLERARQVLVTVSEETRAELSSKDVPGLEAQLRQYQARLEFWYQRLWEMEGIDLDHEELEIHFRGQSVDLTKREYELLVCFLKHPSGFLSSSRLVQLAWGDRLADEQLRVYVTRLRRKLRQLGLPARIENRPRKGYCLLFE